MGQVFSFVDHDITMYLSPDKVRHSSPHLSGVQLHWSWWHHHVPQSWQGKTFIQTDRGPSVQLCWSWYHHVPQSRQGKTFISWDGDLTQAWHDLGQGGQLHWLWWHCHLFLFWNMAIGLLSRKQPTQSIHTTQPHSCSKVGVGSSWGVTLESPCWSLIFRSLYRLFP